MSAIRFLAWLLIVVYALVGQAAAQTEGGNGNSNNSEKKPPPLPNDERLLSLHIEFVKKAEKLASEYERSHQTDKAVVVYQEILKLVPAYPRARQALDKLREQEATAERKVFTIRANQSWQDTGVRVEEGKPVRIKASGQWTFNMSHSLTAEGMEIPKELAEFKLGSLIGVIDTGDAKTRKPFHIGGQVEFIAEQSGPLLVRMHDSDPSDNVGKLTLEITGRFAE